MESPPENLLINALPEVVQSRIARHLTSLQMAVGDVLFYPEEPINVVYFPATALVSFGHTLEDQRTERGFGGNRRPGRRRNLSER